MAQKTVGEKLELIGKMKGRKAIDANARAVTSRSREIWNQSADQLLFTSIRPSLVECPRLSTPPFPAMIGRRNGSVTVIGWVDQKERTRLGWVASHAKGTKPKQWVVRCDCGAYEGRSTQKILNPSRKEYVDACSHCRCAWAENARKEHARTGQWPSSGPPTFRQSHLDRRAAQIYGSVPVIHRDPKR